VHRFPVELNNVTRGYFEAMERIEKGSEGRGPARSLKTPLDAAAVRRLSEEPLYNSMLRTTCVATMVNAGHAPNALPQRAEANVNCRILRAYSAEVRRSS
jgi:acetylornithine deacetylase/succinyl-diaminopimelate desuccinylase-like protein